MEHRYALGDAIDPIEYQAVQMDVEVGGRAKALDEGHRAGVGFGAFESRLFNQKPTWFTSGMIGGMVSVAAGLLGGILAIYGHMKAD